MNQVAVQDQVAIEDMLKAFNCECGKEHRVNITDINISQNPIPPMIDFLKQKKASKVFVLMDSNSFAAAGKKVVSALNSDSYFVTHELCLDGHGRPLAAGAASLGTVVAAMPQNPDIIIAVGSGTINDLSKFVSFRLRVPYVAYATAASMDGYASIVTSLIVNHIKTTYEVQSPAAIYGDLQALQAAPHIMTLAGFGDIFGKYTSLCDWKISSIINGEYYCDEVARHVRFAVDKCCSSLSVMTGEDMYTLKSLMEGLVISGISMSYIGSSRPASGSEHLIAHFWEMDAIQRGEEIPLHGTQTGIATFVIMRLYEKLLHIKPDFEAARDKIKSLQAEEYIRTVEAAFGPAGEEIARSMRNRAEKRPMKMEVFQRIERIEGGWKAVCNAISTFLPDYKTIETQFKEAGMLIHPMQINISRDVFINSVLYAQEMRHRFTVLQLLFDLGLLEEFTQELADEYYGAVG